MATAFSPSNTDNYNIVELTDIDIHAKDHSASTIDFGSDEHSQSASKRNPKISSLKMVDEIFGPLKIGTFSVTRRTLDTLGATVNGQPLDGKTTFFRHPKRSFINALQFSSIHIQARMESTGGASDYTLTSFLFEMASRRPLTAPPLLREGLDPQTQPDQYGRKLDKLLQSAQKLDIRHAHLPKSTPHWVNRIKSSSMVSVGAGLQAFGIYSGLRGLQDAIRKKDEGEVIFNSLSISAELTSLAVEVAVTKQARCMIEAGQKAYSDFAKTSFGVRLGRGAGLIASALTLPFDIISAVKSFNSAAGSTGKTAMDHYVSAGLSVTSAAMTLILGAAALAGFSFIGPVGLVAGLLLVAGSQIYAAVRVVDDIDDYIELSTHERLRTGWFAFFGIDPDDSVQDRYATTKASVEHSKMLQATARKLLDGTLKDSTEVIVNGKFDVELKPTQVRSYDWAAKQDGYKTIKRPYINDGDDDIDARDGVPANTPGAEFGTPGASKGVAWFIGGGDDAILGVVEKPNRFYFGTGKKQLTGGDKDDEFVFETAAKPLNEAITDFRENILEGGAGIDTLVLAGTVKHNDQERHGYHIDLQSGRMSIKSRNQEPGALRTRAHTYLKNIENVETQAGSRNEITGTEGPNIITSRGNDHIVAGGGDDQIQMLNGDGNAIGGAGKDYYFVAHKTGTVTLIEDGKEHSAVMLDWRFDLIDSWRIVGESLIITSTFDANDQNKRILIIEGIYKTTGSERRLQNRNITFITKDGFHLVPDCLETIKDSAPSYIDAVITQSGKIQLPIIINSPELTVAHNQNKNYFISRHSEKTTINVQKASHDVVTTLHVDFASHELSSVEAYYNLDIKHYKAFDAPMYKNCGLVLYFGSKSLTITNLASSVQAGHVLLTDRLRRPILETNHHFILTMNDCVSYRLNQPYLTDDVISKMSGPMYCKEKTLRALIRRSGLRTFSQPADNEAHALGISEKCVNLTAPSEQSTIEVLEGQGSKYLVHLNAGMTLRISTPGALADAPVRLPSASVWEFDATQLGKIEIKLVGNQLLIGQTVIHLPDYKSPDDLVDQIRVIDSEGIIYSIDLVFETVEAEALDARYFKGYSASRKDLPEALLSLAKNEIAVCNIAMKDGNSGTVAYNLSERSWMLDTGTSRPVEYSDLKLLNRCTHQLGHCYALMEYAANATPPVSAADLVTLLDACLIL